LAGSCKEWLSPVQAYSTAVRVVISAGDKGKGEMESEFLDRAEWKDMGEF